MQNTSSQYFRALIILSIALPAGVVLFTLVVFFIFSTGTVPHAMPQLAGMLSIIGYLLAAGGLLAGINLFKGKLLTAKELPRLSDKLNAYRAAIILRYAMLEAPAFFAVIVFFLTGEARVLTVVAGDVLLMLLLIPNKARTIRELGLSSQETDIINDPNGIIE